MKKRATVYETLRGQMEPLSNYALIEMWNVLIGDVRSPHLVPLADVLRKRGVLTAARAKGRKAIVQRFISDESLDRLRKYGSAVPPRKVAVVAAVPAILPKLNVDRVVHKAGNFLLGLYDQSTWTVDTINPMLLRAIPQLATTLVAPVKQRRAAYEAAFQKYGPQRYRLQVHSVKATARRISALVQAGRVLVELRAGECRGVRYIQAVPVSWGDLQ